MDYVKREDHQVIDEQSYKMYLDSAQKQHVLDTLDYQQQLQQALQINANNLVHNIQRSQRQMLMLKTTNHLTRNLNLNEIPAHIPRNSAEMAFIHNFTNELPQNHTRDDLALTQNLPRNLDISLIRSLSNELELQSLNQTLAQSFGDAELVRNLSNDIEQNPDRINDINLTQNLSHEINLSHHLNRQNMDQELLNQDESRRTPMVAQCVSDSHLLDQNMVQRLEQTFAQRLDPSLGQKLGNHGLNVNESQRPIDQNEHMLQLPFHIKSEQEDDSYFYDNINPTLDNVNGINGHITVHPEHTQANPTGIHQDNQMYTYSNAISNVTLNPIDLYTRPQNYIQNYTNITRDNPQNLVVHKQFDNADHYQEELKKLRQDGGANGGKSDSSKNEDPKENLKPSDQNKIFYSEYNQNVQYPNNDIGKNENNSNVSNKLCSDDIALSIKGEYLCYKCSDVFPSKRSLKQHAKTCIDNGDINENAEKMGKFVCTQCPYRCQSPAILKIHERTHTGEKPYSCSYCDYKSGQKNNVAKHVLVHRKEKPFQCQYCEYKCAQKNNLVVHERTHTGHKPFACPFCDYRTVQKPNLVKHMYLHTDQKPFGCDICSYRCVQKTNLTKHKLRHLNEKNGDKDGVVKQNRPYKPRQKSVKCPHCPYRCVQKVSLDKHIKFDHNDVPNKEMYRENIEEGMNLMKHDDEELIQNLSVKKDDFLFNPACPEKIMTPLHS